MKNLFKSPVIILANGLFPSKLIPLDFLENAGTVICTDGAINKLAKLDLLPHVVIGDLDSIDSNLEFKGLIIHDTNQYNTDLAKALEWAIMNNIPKLTILGATGLREDMTLANHYLLFDYYNKIELEMVTDHQTVTCHIGKKSFISHPGNNVSLFVQDFGTTVSTTGLKYPINNSNLNPSSNGICNESIVKSFEIDSSGAILVFRSHLKA